MNKLKQVGIGVAVGLVVSLLLMVAALIYVRSVMRVDKPRSYIEARRVLVVEDVPFNSYKLYDEGVEVNVPGPMHSAAEIDAELPSFVTGDVPVVVSSPYETLAYLTRKEDTVFVWQQDEKVGEFRKVNDNHWTLSLGDAVHYDVYLRGLTGYGTQIFDVYRITEDSPAPEFILWAFKYQEYY